MQPPPQNDVLPPDLSPRRGATTAVGAWAATVAVIAALNAIAPLSSLVTENMQVIAAAMFLYLPTWLLDRQRCAPEAYGLHGRRPWMQAAVATVAAAIVFPLFAAGYHGFQTVVRERSLHVDREVVVRWPQELEDRPKLPTRRSYALWDERGILTVTWNEATRQAPVEVEIALDDAPGAVQAVEVRDGMVYTRALTGRGDVARWPAEDDETVRVRARAPGGVRVAAHSAEQATVTIRRDGELVPAQDIALGRWGVTPDEQPLRYERGWLWLLTVVLIQILVVGLPEEVFYRGLVQTRLRALLPQHVTILGAPFGAAIVVTSVLFALGHFLVELDPGRLAVFFPSLLFGWMRERTGSVAAGAVFHGLSNVLLTVLSRMYAA